jgi:hypothetical protein
MPVSSPQAAVEDRTTERVAVTMDGVAEGGEHGPEWFCGSPKKDGSTCENRAGKGTDHVGVGHCRNHGGSTPTHVRAARRELLARAAERFGLPRDVDPGQAIVESIHKAAGQLDYFEAEVEQLSSPWVEQQTPGGVRVEEHPAVTAYRLSLDRLFGYSERAIKLGLAERAVAVTEVQAALMARAFMALLDDPVLNLSREQREVGRRAAGKHVRQIVQGAVA